MGRFDPKYSPEQKDAIITSIVDEGIKPADTVRLAAAGQLHGLEPFEFNLNTAKTMAGEERRKRRGAELRTMAANGRPEQRLDALTARMLDVIDANLASIERRGRQGKLSMREAQLGKELTKWAREIRGLARGVPPASSGGRNHRNAAQTQRPGETPPGQERAPDQPTALEQEMLNRIAAEETAAQARAGKP